MVLFGPCHTNSLEAVPRGRTLREVDAPGKTWPLFSPILTKTLASLCSPESHRSAGGCERTLVFCPVQIIVCPCSCIGAGSPVNVLCRSSSQSTEELYTRVTKSRSLFAVPAKPVRGWIHWGGPACAWMPDGKMQRFDCARAAGHLLCLRPESPSLLISPGPGL